MEFQLKVSKHNIQINTHNS